MKTLKALAILLLTLTPALSKVVPMNPNGVIKASFHEEEMTRIAVDGGRIREVFGDLSSIVVEKDETLGQLYLIPNGASENKIRLSLVTDSGETQDLILIKSSSADPVLILKTTSQQKNPQRVDPAFSLVPSEASSSHSSSGYIPNLLAFMKVLVARGSTDIYDGAESRSHKGVQITGIFSYEGSSLQGSVYAVKNTSQKPIRLCEAGFWKPGDLALSLKYQILPAGSVTHLFVIRSLIS